MKTPYDIELNAAILHLSDKLLCQGFDVKADTLSFVEEGAKLQRGERFAVPMETDPDSSLFADAEVEHAFRALVCHMAFQPATLALHDHGEFVSCPGQFLETIEALGCELVKRFGDDERTRQWCRVLTVYFLSNICRSLIVGAVGGGWDRRALTEHALGKFADVENIGEDLAGFLAWLMQRVATLDIIALPDETDPRQNAPTSARMQ